MNPDIYNINVLKDPLCNFLFSRNRNYFVILAFFGSFQVIANYFSGCLMEIDSISIHYERTVLFAWKDPLFYIYHVMAIILFPIVRRFFHYVPEAFKTLFKNGIFTKEEKQQERILAKYNKSLKEFENSSNGKYVYTIAFFLHFLTMLFFRVSATTVEESSLILWQDIHFFPVSWGAFVVVTSLMWFIVGILIWKMLSVIFFIRKLAREYNFTMKPFHSDGFGGFKPLGQLWLNMIFIAAPIVFYCTIVVFFFHSFGIPYFSGTKAYWFIGILYGIFAAHLIYPMYNYHCIIEDLKVNLLEDIEKKVDACYERIEDTFRSEKWRKTDKDSMEQLKHFHEISIRISSVPSWPFTSFEKVLIYVGAAAPWVGALVSYYK